MFYFAWVDKTETTFESYHQREDEQVFSLRLTHNEGDFPGLEMEIRNPRVGLLNANRKQWAWVSWRNPANDIVVPLFFGRLVGAPEDLQNEIVRLLFVGRPADYDQQKLDLAETMKVLPYWDPVFVSEEEREDPDRVLEARPLLWHIDRVTHQVSASSIVTGEDGTTTFPADKVLNESVRVSYGQPPARAVELQAEVSWQQAVTGVVPIMTNQVIETLTGSGLEKDWPKKGASIGGGWAVENSSVKVPKMYAPVLTGRQAIIDLGLGTFTGGADGVTYDFRYPPYFMEPSGSCVVIPIWRMNCNLSARYAAARNYAEKLAFTLYADVQPVLTEPGEEEILRISIGRGDAGAPIDGIAPIGNVRRRQYFNTDRGKQSLAYLVGIARARLLARARAVTVEFSVPFAEAVNLSCRKNAVIENDKLPGGVAAGKVTAYSLVADGTGAMIATVSLGCMVGKGNELELNSGTPDYVDEGYVAEGYQTYTGGYFIPDAGDVAVLDFSHILPEDDGVNMMSMGRGNNVLDLTITGTKEEQIAAMTGSGPSVKTAQNLIENINTKHTQISLQMRPIIGGPFETPYDLMLTDLVVPKTIDLEYGEAFTATEPAMEESA